MKSLKWRLWHGGLCGPYLILSFYLQDFCALVKEFNFTQGK